MATHLHLVLLPQDVEGHPLQTLHGAVDEVATRVQAAVLAVTLQVGRQATFVSQTADAVQGWKQRTAVRV